MSRTARLLWDFHAYFPTCLWAHQWLGSQPTWEWNGFSHGLMSIDLP